MPRLVALVMPPGNTNARPIMVSEAEFGSLRVKFGYPEMVWLISFHSPFGRGNVGGSLNFEISQGSAIVCVDDH